MQNSSSRSAANKVFPRSLRAETRNRAKDELKRVINATEKVRKWERRWVLLKDSSINVYKWVPVAGQSSIITPKAPPVTKTAPVAGDETNTSLISAENSNDETNVTAVSRINEDSNAAFSEVGFDSDSNQTGTFDRIDYKPEAGDESSTVKQIDFSELVREEAATRNLKSNGGDSTPNVRKRPAANSAIAAGSEDASASSSRKSSRH